MLTLSKTNQIIIGAVLTGLIIATRGHHFASINSLPSASLAVFFLAGLYLRPTWVFPSLLALCAGLDFYSITFAGTSSFCVTPAYGFLLPAYGVMWLAGRWFAKRVSFSIKALLPLVGSVAIAATVSELFSSGGFYFFGGRYPDPTLAVFGERLMKYFPHQLENISFWLGVALIVHVAFALANKQQRAKV
ncbi:MAG: hypothetical protein PHO76_08825 [Methylotenera sp.]|nr:hypothetical protein [Methylotenera sp.]MDD4925273.1 hypothetical protein [Methylotenera sp.]NOU41497.1 hypothetical protein [Methylotenera sp.]